MQTIYNSYRKKFKTPFGAVKRNEEITFRIYLNNDLGYVKEPKLLVCEHNQWHDTKEYNMHYINTKENISEFEVRCSFGELGVYYYRFGFYLNDKMSYLKRNTENNEAYITEYDNNENLWQITVYHEGFESPKDFQGKLMYQIFIDRFHRGSDEKPILYGRILKNWGELPDVLPNEDGEVLNNDFFGGDLQGVIEKLPYLKKLGIDIIYLTPIMESNSNHRYDTANYLNVDPYVGKWKDLEELCKKAHKKNMKIILDGVFSHTGADSLYFNKFGRYDSVGAYQSINSPYRNWYQYIDRENPDNYHAWWGFKNLPTLDKTNEEYINLICGENGVIDNLFKAGIDGMRLDVADELPEEFLESIKSAVERNGKGKYILIGEVWENAIRKQKDGNLRTYLLGKSLDSVMNYPFKESILRYIRYGDYNGFRNNIMEILEDYPITSIQMLMNSLSTHDSVRAITALAGEELGKHDGDRKWQLEHDILSREQFKKGKKMFKLATIIQYFLPGIPCIYYGDEVKSYGYKDPLCRKCYPWGKRDKELLKFFRNLGKVRKSVISCLSKGESRICYIDDKKLMFERYECNTNERVLISINRTDSNISIPNLYEKNGQVIFKIGNSTPVSLAPYGAIIIKN